MVVDAKAKGLQVLLTLFGPYGKDQVTGQPATFPETVVEYNNLLNALAVEQAVSREYVSAQMGPDGLHPSQTGYDELADALYPQAADDVPALPCRPGHVSVSRPYLKP